MVKGLYTAYTGMINEQRRLDILSNNLANSTTVGYKKEGTTSTAFSDKLALRIKDITEPLTARRLGIVNLGVKLGQVYTDYDQGGFRVTDRPADLAIAGDGFFAIEFTNKAGESSIKYTRDGEFTVDNQGFFRTEDGDYLLNKQAALNSQMGAGNYVQVDPMQKYTVDGLGNIYQGGEQVAQIGLVDIADYEFISKYGENYFQLVDGGAVVDSDATIEQGTLETSNVNVVDEMVSMIAIQRAYEANQRVITTLDTTLEQSVDRVGRV